jgi:hypothetical protein
MSKLRRGVKVVSRIAGRRWRHYCDLLLDDSDRAERPDEWETAMDDWWSEIDDAVRDCLQRHGAMAPADIGHELGLSEATVSSVVSLLAQEGKLRIARVELFDPPPGA